MSKGPRARAAASLAFLALLALVAQLAQLDQLPQSWNVSRPLVADQCQLPPLLLHLQRSKATAIRIEQAESKTYRYQSPQGQQVDAVRS